MEEKVKSRFDQVSQHPGADPPLPPSIGHKNKNLEADQRRLEKKEHESK